MSARKFFVGDVVNKKRCHRKLDCIESVAHAAATNIVLKAQYNLLVHQNQL